MRSVAQHSTAHQSRRRGNGVLQQRAVDQHRVELGVSGAEITRTHHCVHTQCEGAGCWVCVVT